MSKHLSVPSFDAIWRIGQHYIELLHPASIGECRTFKGIVIHNREIMYAMQIQVHTGNGGGAGIDLLAKDFHIAPFLAFVLQVG